MLTQLLINWTLLLLTSHFINCFSSFFKRAFKKVYNVSVKKKRLQKHNWTRKKQRRTRASKLRESSLSKRTESSSDVFLRSDFSKKSITTILNEKIVFSARALRSRAKTKIKSEKMRKSARVQKKKTFVIEDYNSSQQMSLHCDNMSRALPPRRW